jgi:hypothetical protein
MSAPSLLTLTEVATISGAIAAVTASANALYYVWGLNQRLTGIISSFVVSGLGASMSTEQTVSIWVVAVFNAFIIYCGSVGASAMGSAASGTKTSRASKASPIEEIGEPPPRRFWREWY